MWSKEPRCGPQGLDRPVQGAGPNETGSLALRSVGGVSGAFWMCHWIGFESVTGTAAGSGGEILGDDLLPDFFALLGERVQAPLLLIFGDDQFDDVAVLEAP